MILKDSECWVRPVVLHIFQVYVCLPIAKATAWSCVCQCLWCAAAFAVVRSMLLGANQRAPTCWWKQTAVAPPDDSSAQVVSPLKDFAKWGLLIPVFEIQPQYDDKHSKLLTGIKINTMKQEDIIKCIILTHGTLLVAQQ